MKRFRFLCFGLFLVSSPALFAQVVDVPTVKAQVQQQRQGLDQEKSEKLATLKAGYFRALNDLLRDVMAKGDLEMVQAVRGEMTRLESGGLLPDGYSVYEGLNRMQTKLRYLVEDIDNEYGHALIQLYEQQDAQLKQAEVSMVKANRINDAIQIRSVRDGLKADPTYLAFQQQLQNRNSDPSNRPELTETWKYFSDLPHAKCTDWTRKNGAGDGFRA